MRGLFVALIGAALASVAPQGHGQPAKTQQTNANAISLVGTRQRPADATKQEAQGCPGTQYPRLNCSAISAQAELEQARQSQLQTGQTSRQGDLFRTEILVSFLTMFAAVAAAIFAGRAASAAQTTADAFIEVERADIVLTLENFRDTSLYNYDPHTATTSLATAQFKFDIVANNLGRSSALITKVTSGWKPGTTLEKNNSVLMGKNKAYIVLPGKNEVLDVDDNKRTLDALRVQSYLWVQLFYRSALRDRERVMRQWFRVLWPAENRVNYTQGEPEHWDEKGKWDYTLHRFVEFPTGRIVELRRKLAELIAPKE